jgi:nucleoside-diphosphate kinase
MKTLLMIKPDIIEHGHHGDIIAIVVRNRFKIKAIRMLEFNRARAEEFYDVHRDKAFFGSLIDYVTSGPVIALQIEGENVVDKVRVLIGTTDPAKSNPGTIRYMYGSSIQNNAVHASDSPESAKKELAIVFGDF